MANSQRPGILLKRVCQQDGNRNLYPTIQELTKKISPPGSTPITSRTNFMSDDATTTSGDESTSSGSTNHVLRDQKTQTYGVKIVPELTHSVKATISRGTAKKQGLLLKDSNSNVVVISDDDRAESVTTTEPDLWDCTGETCTIIATDKPGPTPSSRRACSSASRQGSRTNCLRPGPSRAGGSKSDYSLARERSEDRDYEIDATTNYTPSYYTTSSVEAARRNQKDFPNLHGIIDELREKEVVFDRTTAVAALKQRILRGDKVTHDEIKALRHLTIAPSQRHLGMRLPWSKDLCCVKGLVHIPTPNKPASLTNSFGTMDDLRIPSENRVTLEHWGRRQYVLNLGGFLDEDISLYLEGKTRLVIRANRPDRKGKPSMSITETILLPPDLPADNLRIVRKPSGTTIIEESWRF